MDSNKKLWQPEVVVLQVTRDELRAMITSAVEAAVSELKGESQNRDDELLTLQEAQALLKVSPKTLYNWRRCGHLPSRSINGRTYILKSELLKAIAND